MLPDLHESSSLERSTINVRLVPTLDEAPELPVKHSMGFAEFAHKVN
jgi:hypothetical protein